MKLAFLDLETTGLDHEKCAIVEIYCEVVLGDNSLGDFYAEMQPHKDAWIQAPALLANGISEAELRDGTRLDNAATQKAFQGFLYTLVEKYNKRDKLFCVAYNGQSFDMPFLREWFKRGGERYFGSYFHWPCLDVAILAQAALGAEWADLEDHKLLTVAQRFGIQEEGKLHTAKADVHLLKGIYYAAMKTLRIPA